MILCGPNSALQEQEIEICPWYVVWKCGRENQWVSFGIVLLKVKAIYVTYIGVKKVLEKHFYNLWWLWNLFRILLKHRCRLLLWQNFDRRCWSITKKVLPAWAASTSFWCIIFSIIFNFLSHWSIRQRNFSQKQLASPNANWEIFSLHYGGSNQGIAGCQFFIGSPHWAQNLDFLL